VIRLEVTTLFFDRQIVRDRVDAATRRVLSRFGAFVRQGARTSIRRRKRISRPGEPPSSHTGLLRRLIFFGYDSREKSVVIGPAPLNGVGRGEGGEGGEAPSLLEHGGTTTLKRRGRRVRATYRPRPYMGPAFAKEQPKLPALWRDAVR